MVTESCILATMRWLGGARWWFRCGRVHRTRLKKCCRSSCRCRVGSLAVRRRLGALRLPVDALTRMLLCWKGLDCDTVSLSKTLSPNSPLSGLFMTLHCACWRARPRHDSGRFNPPFTHRNGQISRSRVVAQPVNQILGSTQRLLHRFLRLSLPDSRRFASFSSFVGPARNFFLFLEPACHAVAVALLVTQ